MNKHIVSTLFILILLNLSSSGLNTTVQEPILDIDIEASRLTYKIDGLGNGHFLYVSGPETPFEPAGEPVEFEDEYKLIYGFRDVKTGRIDLYTFDVDNIFPYDYNLQIDSSGQVHLAFIANYTLYYALRTSSGNWTNTPMNVNTDWLAYQPDIALGDNEDPRIVYVANYQDGASEYFDTTIQNSFRAVHYAVKNSTGWFYYDVSMNTGVSTSKDPTKFMVFNPGILIEKGTVYLSYNIDYGVGISSNMEFLRFSEFPDDELRDQSFDQFRFPKIYEASIRATKFRRPSIITINNDIILLVGTWFTGGGIIAYLNDASAIPEISDIGSTSDQWEIFQIENNRRSLSIESFRGTLFEDQNRIIATYSTYQLFDESKGLFNEDILLLSFSPSNVGLGPVGYGRVTNTNNINNKYPAVSVTASNEIQVNWLSWDQTNNTKLLQDKIDLSTYSFETRSKPDLGDDQTTDVDEITLEPRDSVTSTSLLLFNSNFLYILVIIPFYHRFKK